MRPISSASTAETAAVEETAPEFDCQSCGACCRFGGEVIVTRSDDVPRHLTRSARSLRIGSWAPGDIVRMARAEGGQCIALRGEIGTSCRCAIYARRPAPCREFEPGSLACRGARSAALP